MQEENNGANISAWQKSGEYQSDLTALCEAIMSKSLHSNSEATTAAIFENNLYHILKVKTGISLDFRKEVSITGVKNVMHRFSSQRGRMDAVVNNLLIEYKHNSKLSSKTEQASAFHQVESYLFALKEKEGQEFNAILTDGVNIAYFAFSEGDVKHSALSPLTSKDIDILINGILSNNRKKFVPQNILSDFSINAKTESCAKNIARILHHNLIHRGTDKTTMLFEEWQTLMHLSVDDDGKGHDISKRRKDLSQIFAVDIKTPKEEYGALYALQTTYAIIVKLIACKVVDCLGYNQNTNYYDDLMKVSSGELQVFFQRVENGYSYRYSDLINFLEGDFFSWYADETQWTKEFSEEIKKLMWDIDKYSSFSFHIIYEPIDIFKDLYMSIIPDSVRHSMGEYYTPKWLADHVVKEALSHIHEEHWRAIDPCCGSGIFIITLIKTILADKSLYDLDEEEKNRIKNDILQRVYGIDINPLSVLSARVGYYLALQPLGEMQNIEIPVYLGDSAIMPSSEVVDDIPCYKHTIHNSKKNFDFILPCRFVEHKAFGKTMYDLQSYVNIEDSDVLYQGIIQGFNEEEKNSATLIAEVKEMAKNLVNLKTQSWDGIWIRIITNFMYIARLRSFDIIVGNPPWVKWEHLPTAYAQRIKELCDKKHIFSGQGQYGGTQLNICALISNVTASNWLKDTGVLAFLMPDSIMSQNSYEGFRHFYIDYEKKTRLYLQKLDKWTSPLRPFSSGSKTVTQDFNTYYYGYTQVDYQKGLPVEIITRQKKVSNEMLNTLDSIDKAREHLEYTQTEALQLTTKSSAFSYRSKEYDFSQIIGATSYLYRTGVEFTPQEIFMLQGQGKSSKADSYRFRNMKFLRSKYHVTDTPAKGWDLPTKHIYPIVTSPNLSLYHFDTGNQFCILPYTKEDTKHTIPREVLQEEQKDLFLYLINHAHLIKQQSEKSKLMHRGDEFYALSKIGPYTFAPAMVAAKDNGRFCASVINPVETPWGEQSMPICVKHTIIISQRKNKDFIHQDEAYYISAVLNSSVVRTYLMTNFKSNGISLNKSNIYLPEYDPLDDDFLALSQLGREGEGSTTAEEAEKISLASTQVYLALCSRKVQP